MENMKMISKKSQKEKKQKNHNMRKNLILTIVILIQIKKAVLHQNLIQINLEHKLLFQMLKCNLLKLLVVGLLKEQNKKLK